MATTHHLHSRRARMRLTAADKVTLSMFDDPFDEVEDEETGEWMPSPYEIVCEDNPQVADDLDGIHRGLDKIYAHWAEKARATIYPCYWEGAPMDGLALVGEPASIGSPVIFGVEGEDLRYGIVTATTGDSLVVDAAELWYPRDCDPEVWFAFAAYAAEGGAACEYGGDVYTYETAADALADWLEPGAEEFGQYSVGQLIVSSSDKGDKAQVRDLLTGDIVREWDEPDYDGDPEAEFSVSDYPGLYSAMTYAFGQVGMPVQPYLI